MEAGEKAPILARLRGALGEGAMTVGEFEAAVELVLAATREEDLVDLVRKFAPPVRITPVDRRYRDVVRHTTSGPFADIRLRGNWQVPRHLVVKTGPSKIVLDFTEAEFDEWETDIEAQTGLGDVVVVVPRGAAVQLVGVAGSGLSKSKLEPAQPGFPLIRLSVMIGIGRFRIKHPRLSRAERKALKSG